MQLNLAELGIINLHTGQGFKSLTSMEKFHTGNLQQYEYLVSYSEPPPYSAITSQGGEEAPPAYDTLYPGKESHQGIPPV